MTCKDCLHFKVCEYEGVYFEDMQIKASHVDGIEELCFLFENKADFVEVVRCGKCECFIPDSELNHEEYPNPLEADGWCENIQCYAYKDDFCSYGERR